jgi:hypothetical protein
MDRSVLGSFAPAAAVVLLLAACGGSGGSGGSDGGSATGTTQAVTPTTAADTACVPAAIHGGAPPRWTASIDIQVHPARSHRRA